MTKPTVAFDLAAGVAALDAIFGDLIRAATPPNPQFERERIVRDLANRREIVFLLGLSSEGENEAALLLALIASMKALDPHAETAHVLDEAAYYLRTSIDGQWQLASGPTTEFVICTYLQTIFLARLERLSRGGEITDDTMERRAVLEALFDARVPAES